MFVNNKAPITKYVSKASLNTGRVTVRHIAVAPAVDVFVNGNVAIAGLTNPNQAQAKLERGTYQVAAGLAGAGAAGIALGPVPLPVKAGYNVDRVRMGHPAVRGRRRRPGRGAVRQAHPRQAALVRLVGWNGRVTLTGGAAVLL